MNKDQPLYTFGVPWAALYSHAGTKPFRHLRAFVPGYPGGWLHITTNRSMKRVRQAIRRFTKGNPSVIERGWTHRSRDTLLVYLHAPKDVVKKWETD